MATSKPSIQPKQSYVFPEATEEDEELANLSDETWTVPGGSQISVNLLKEYIHQNAQLPESNEGPLGALPLVHLSGSQCVVFSG